MTDAKREIKAECLHSDDDIREEAFQFLGLSPLAPTLGQVAMLHGARNPLLTGGDITTEAVAEAQKVLGTDMGAEEIMRALAAAFRPYETIRAGGGRKGGTEVWSPEWIADTVALAARALPSLTLHQALWEMPMCVLVHLGASAYRAMGGDTGRPVDYRAALARLKEDKDGKETSGDDQR